MRSSPRGSALQIDNHRLQQQVTRTKYGMEALPLQGCPALDQLFYNTKRLFLQIAFQLPIYFQLKVLSHRNTERIIPRIFNLSRKCLHFHFLMFFSKAICSEYMRCYSIINIIFLLIHFFQSIVGFMNTINKIRHSSFNIIAILF